MPTIEVSEATLALVQKEAMLQGKSASVILDDIVDRHFATAHNGNGSEPVTALSEADEERLWWDTLTEEEKQAEREAMQRAIEDDKAGRVKPLSQVIAEARERHGFSEEWPYAPH